MQLRLLLAISLLEIIFCFSYLSTDSGATWAPFNTIPHRFIGTQYELPNGLNYRVYLYEPLATYILGFPLPPQHLNADGSALSDYGFEQNCIASNYVPSAVDLTDYPTILWQASVSPMTCSTQIHGDRRWIQSVVARGFSAYMSFWSAGPLTVGGYFNPWGDFTDDVPIPMYIGQISQMRPTLVTLLGCMGRLEGSNETWQVNMTLETHDPLVDLMAHPGRYLPYSLFLVFLSMCTFFGSIIGLRRHKNNLWRWHTIVFIIEGLIAAPVRIFASLTITPASMCGVLCPLSFAHHPDAGAFFAYFDPVLSMPTTVIMSLVWVKLGFLASAPRKALLAFDTLIGVLAITVGSLLLYFSLDFSTFNEEGILLSLSGSGVVIVVEKSNTISAFIIAVLGIVIGIFVLCNAAWLFKILSLAAKAKSEELAGVGRKSLKWAVIQLALLTLVYVCIVAGLDFTKKLGMQLNDEGILEGSHRYYAVMSWFVEPVAESSSMRADGQS